jgi:hypothetical protein
MAAASYIECEIYINCEVYIDSEVYINREVYIDSDIYINCEIYSSCLLPVIYLDRREHSRQLGSYLGLSSILRSTPLDQAFFGIILR